MAFKRMKKSIAKLPMLTTLKEKEELIIYLAAAKEAVSAVLMTEMDGKQMPIYFFSRALQGPEINYTLMEKLILSLEDDPQDTAMGDEEALSDPWILDPLPSYITEVKHDLSNEMCASSDEEKAYMKKVPYASAVGSIMYAVRCTRPDVAFAQNLVSRYQRNPRKLHWIAVKHILKYLRNTKDMFLVYEENPDTELEVKGFFDASWQCDKDDTKSQMGYVFVVNRGAVDWKSKKQTTIEMHATQSEYMAA
nr:retrovirus-related Pol polyprotein from transposon TNT 1-94 [Tanacetum cinerariifolium]